MDRRPRVFPSIIKTDTTQSNYPMNGTKNLGEIVKGGMPQEKGRKRRGSTREVGEEKREKTGVFSAWEKSQTRRQLWCGGVMEKPHGKFLHAHSGRERQRSLQKIGTKKTQGAGKQRE